MTLKKEDQLGAPDPSSHRAMSAVADSVISSRSVQLQAMMSRSPEDPVDIDIGPALMKATGTSQPGASREDELLAGDGTEDLTGGRPSKVRQIVAKNHPAVRHLSTCEPKHCWQWVPDDKLSALWRELGPEERRQVVQTHVDSQPTRKFRDEISAHVRPRDCCASEQAKRRLGSVILHDQHSLSIYAEMFVVAVEENVPLTINMEVIEAVDGVVQNFCAARGLRERHLGYLDPRTFPEGSTLWVQYCEHEHVRLMWMSAMTRIFEVRLLEIWEERHGAAEREAAEEASMQAAMELLELEGDSCDAVARNKGEPPPSIRRKKQRRKQQKQRRREAIRGAVSELRDMEARVRDGEGDEIDAEFNCRVLEHLRSRAEVAKRNSKVQTERGNAIIKTLCEKLKAQLETSDTCDRV